MMGNLRMSSTDKHLEPSARLQFLAGWQTVKHGSIRPGGQLIIDYDICRLPNLRTRFRDIIFWQIEAFVRFHPSGELYTSSVTGGNFDDAGRRPFRGHRSKPFEFVVPRDAIRVEVWFRSGCQDSGRPEDVAWDSRFGQNYWFDVIHTQTDKCTDGKNRRLFPILRSESCYPNSRVAADRLRVQASLRITAVPSATSIGSLRSIDARRHHKHSTGPGSRILPREVK